MPGESELDTKSRPLVFFFSSELTSLWLHSHVDYFVIEGPEVILTRS